MRLWLPLDSGSSCPPPPFNGGSNARGFETATGRDWLPDKYSLARYAGTPVNLASPATAEIATC